MKGVLHLLEVPPVIGNVIVDFGNAAVFEQDVPVPDTPARYINGLESCPVDQQEPMVCRFRKRIYPGSWVADVLHPLQELRDNPTDFTDQFIPLLDSEANLLVANRIVG